MRAAPSTRMRPCASGSAGRGECCRVPRGRRRSPRNRGISGGSSRSTLLRKDLAHPAVEHQVARPGTGDLTANARLVLAHGRREGGEATLDEIALGHRVELLCALEHPDRTHRLTCLSYFVDRFT